MTLTEKIEAFAKDVELDVEAVWVDFLTFFEGKKASNQGLTVGEMNGTEQPESAPAEATPVESPTEVSPEKGDLLPQEAPVESAPESASVEPVAQ